MHIPRHDGCDAVVPPIEHHLRRRNGHSGPLHAASNRAEAAAHETSISRRSELETLTRRQLELIGEDPQREGLMKTPERVSKSLAWLTQGYEQDLLEVVGDAIFEEKHAGMVLVRDIEMYSLCEHHLLPFFGRVHIAYVPDGRVIGLSKLPRLVDVFARRLQVQERLTEEVADAVMQVLRPKGVRVTVDAVHLCMMMRGVRKQNSSTITSVARGAFLMDPSLAEEYQRLVDAGTRRY